MNINYYERQTSHLLSINTNYFWQQKKKLNWESENSKIAA